MHAARRFEQELEAYKRPGRNRWIGQRDAGAINRIATGGPLAALAVAFGIALLIGAMVLYVNAISE